MYVCIRGGGGWESCDQGRKIWFRLNGHQRDKTPGNTGRAPQSPSLRFFYALDSSRGCHSQSLLSRWARARDRGGLLEQEAAIEGTGFPPSSKVTVPSFPSARGMDIHSRNDAPCS